MTKNIKKTLRAFKSKKIVNLPIKEENLTNNSESDQNKNLKITKELKISTTLLSKNNESHYEIFKKIITDENVIFNSWFIASCFDIYSLQSYCDSFELKIKLTLADDPDIKLPAEIIAQTSTKTSTQLAINRFFSFEEREKNLKELYQIITSDSEKTGLGYFIFEDSEKNLLGGGALIIIEDETNSNKKVDLALHILKQNCGIGNLCLEKLFQIAFQEKKIDEIWSRSLKEGINVANFMGKHGMVIRTDDNNEDFYFINKSIYESLQK